MSHQAVTTLLPTAFSPALLEVCHRSWLQLGSRKTKAMLTYSALDCRTALDRGKNYPNLHSLWIKQTRTKKLQPRWSQEKYTTWIFFSIPRDWNLETLWQKITKKSDNELNEPETSCPEAHDVEGATAESLLLVMNWDTWRWNRLKIIK